VSKNALWLRPELVIRAEFAGWTGDGLVRQAAYKGFDLGKDPRKVRREVARASG
jgi:bifunctional non-homologous end joining protein LigD